MPEETISQWLLKLNEAVEQTNHHYPLNLVPGWPIPFFGDVLRARVLTVSVNPSDQEFNSDRRWDAITNPEQWQTRLLNYFRISGVPPWCWFDTWSICLDLIGRAYAAGDAAHIDISPRPTTPMLDQQTDTTEFRGMVEHDVKWFFQLLDHLPQVQLLLVAGPIPRANGQKQQLADFIHEQAGRHGAKWRQTDPLPTLVTPGHPTGIPVFVCPYEPKADGLYAMVRQVYRNRKILRRLSAPGMSSVPIMPARLDWPSAIGNFLLNYGTLDYFVFVFLKDHLSSDEFGRIREWHFNDRLKRIAQYLKDEKYPADQQTAFARLLERLEPIRELRNHLAHGHMYLRFDPETLKPRVTLFKAKDLDTGLLPESKHVEFHELLTALATLTGLIEEFQRLAGFKATGGGPAAEDLEG